MGILRLTLTPQAPLTVPLSRCEGLQGLFYRLLSADGPLADEIHDKAPGEHRPYKFYCFTDLHGTYTALPGGRRYEGPLTWEVRAADERIIAAVTAATAAGQLRLYDTPCAVTATPVALPAYGEERLLTMDTPLTVYRTDHTRHTVYYAPDDPRFARGVEGNIRRKWRAFCGEEIDGLSFTPTAVPADARRVIRYKQTVLTAYYGQYRLLAPPAVQAFLQLVGLGAKNGMGLGTISM